MNDQLITWYNGDAFRASDVRFIEAHNEDGPWCVRVVFSYDAEWECKCKSKAKAVGYRDGLIAKINNALAGGQRNLLNY